MRLCIALVWENFLLMGFRCLGFLSYHSRKVSDLFRCLCCPCPALYGLEAVVLVETVTLPHADMGQTLISEPCVSSRELRFTLEGRPLPSTEWVVTVAAVWPWDLLEALLKGKVISSKWRLSYHKILLYNLSFLLFCLLKKLIYHSWLNMELIKYKQTG